MAIVAPPSPKTAVRELDPGGPVPPGAPAMPAGRGGWGDSWGGRPDLPERRYYTGMLVLMAGVTMLFAAFTSAYIVRKGISDDWRPTAFPVLVWVNTLVLLASSLTLERARRLYGQTAALTKWWLATTGLGVIFLLGQLVVWQQLAAAGIHLRTNPSSAFIYILTGAHAVHLLGGVAALVYWSRRLLQDRPPTRTVLNVTAIYWHFLDGLWVYLLLFILFWR